MHATSNSSELCERKLVVQSRSDSAAAAALGSSKQQRARQPLNQSLDMQYSPAFVDAALNGDAAYVMLHVKELDAQVQLDADVRQPSIELRIQCFRAILANWRPRSLVAQVSSPSAVCWFAKTLLLNEPAIQVLVFMRANHGDRCSAQELASRPALLSLFDVLCSMENVDDRHIVKAMNKALTMSEKHLTFLSSGPRKIIREYVDSLSNRDDVKKGGR